MSQRDRILLMAIVVVAVVGAGWLMFVSPERQKASKLAAQVSSAQAALSGAEGKLSEARNDQTQYAKAYAEIVSLGKAVPAADEVPSLIYQLERASNSRKVDFTSITSGAAGSPTPAASSSSSSSGSSTTAVANAGFTAMPFTFVFSGSYFDLEHLFASLNTFTLRRTAGPLQVSGRLLTINSVKLTPVGQGQNTHGHQTQLSGTITATAYILPASQGLTAGATPSGPSGTATSTGTSSTSSSATPAVVTP